MSAVRVPPRAAGRLGAVAALALAAACGPPESRGTGASSDEATGRPAADRATPPPAPLAAPSPQSSEPATAPLELSRPVFWYTGHPAAFLVGGPAPLLSDPAARMTGLAFLVDANRCGPEVRLSGPAPADLLDRYTRSNVPVAGVEGGGPAGDLRPGRLALLAGDCPGEDAPRAVDASVPDRLLVDQLFALVRDTLNEHWGGGIELVGGQVTAWRFSGGATEFWVMLAVDVEERPSRRFALIAAERVSPDSLRILALEPVGMREPILPVAALDVDGDGRPEVLAYRAWDVPGGSAHGVMIFRRGEDGWRRWKAVALYLAEV